MHELHRQQRVLDGVFHVYSTVESPHQACCTVVLVRHVPFQWEPAQSPLHPDHIAMRSPEGGENILYVDGFLDFHVADDAKAHPGLFLPRLISNLGVRWIGRKPEYSNCA